MPTPSKQAAGGSGAEDGRAAGQAGLRAFEAGGLLAGRPADRARIDRFLESIARTPDGGGPLDLLLGEPGAGKTALLAATTARAEHRGMHVVATAGAEYRAHLSYSGLGAAASRPGRSPFRGPGPPGRPAARPRIGCP
ncbi:hypothetical protein OG749_44510 [Streptomyces nojiriensis]|uniref:AAA family ATPase n=1 Tax=Streptomyces nojiriensis TaxID=66374 RepID=UPI002E18A3C5